MSNQTAKKLKKALPYLFISPFFIMYSIFGLYPFLSGLTLSLFNKKDEFILFENYIDVITDDKFHTAIINAFLYTLGSLFIILPIALGAAMILNHKFIGKKVGLFSTIFYIPNVTSVLVVGIVFQFILRTNNGVINTLLQSIGIVDEGIKFLSDPAWAIPSLVIIGSWRYFGVNSLFFLSGLQGIPAEYGEAARIDGATPIKEFWHITLPLLRPILTYVTFTAITGSFAMFGEVYTLTNGSTGARNSMLYPVIYLYNMMFRDNQMNRAASMGYLIAVILLILTSIQRYVLRKKD